MTTNTGQSGERTVAKLSPQDRRFLPILRAIMSSDYLITAINNMIRQTGDESGFWQWLVKKLAEKDIRSPWKIAPATLDEPTRSFLKKVFKTKPIAAPAPTPVPAPTPAPAPTPEPTASPQPNSVIAPTQAPASEAIKFATPLRTKSPTTASAVQSLDVRRDLSITTGEEFANWLVQFYLLGKEDTKYQLFLALVRNPKVTAMELAKQTAQNLGVVFKTPKDHEDFIIASLPKSDRNDAFFWAQFLQKHLPYQDVLRTHLLTELLPPRLRITQAIADAYNLYQTAKAKPAPTTYSFGEWLEKCFARRKKKEVKDFILALHRQPEKSVHDIAMEFLRTNYPRAALGQPQVDDLCHKALLILLERTCHSLNGNSQGGQARIQAIRPKLDAGLRERHLRYVISIGAVQRKHRDAAARQA